MDKKDHYRSMRKIILSCLIFIPFIPLILDLGIGYTHFTNALKDTTIERMRRNVEDHKLMLETFLHERKTDLNFLAESFSFEELCQPESLKKAFKRLQKASNAFVDLGLFNEAGVHLAYNGPYALTEKKYSDENWFMEVLKNGYYISNVFMGLRQVPHFIIAVLKTDENGKWVIRATIDPYMFNSIINRVRIGKTGECYLINSKGIFQTVQRSGGERLQKDPDYRLYDKYHAGVRTFIAKDHRGETYLYATSWINDNHWLLVVRQEKADAFSAFSSSIYLIMLISVCEIAAIIILAIYFTNFIIRKMESADVEKEQLHHQLIQCSRLAEIGEMAADFAHEINNPLQIIKNENALIGVNLSDMKGKESVMPSAELSDVEESLDQIELQINRCAKITQAILKFSRQSDPVLVDIDLRRFIPEITKMIDTRASVSDIRIVQEISKDTPIIHGDPNQLQQVLINLCNNALDAIEKQRKKEEGRLLICCQSTENYRVEISINDNGCGISPENLNKLFLPFFTTKPVGKGTGLGLSVCFGIIEAMGGTIKVRSQLGVGSTFTIDLPIAHEKL
jgi:two-component system NtrC family sensor kinase